MSVRRSTTSPPPRAVHEEEQPRRKDASKRATEAHAATLERARALSVGAKKAELEGAHRQAGAATGAGNLVKSLAERIKEALQQLAADAASNAVVTDGGYSFQNTEHVNVASDVSGNSTITVRYTNGRSEQYQRDAAEGPFDLQIDGGTVVVNGNPPIGTITGSDKDETVDVRSGTVGSIDLGGGEDVVEVARDAIVEDTVRLGGGDDTLVNQGQVGAVYGGEGNDRFRNINQGVALELHGEGGDDTFDVHGYAGPIRAASVGAVYGGEGDDEIDIGPEGRLGEAHGEAGEDFIWNRGVLGNAYGGAGNDEIRNDGDADEISGGAGDDRITNWSAASGWPRGLPRAARISGDAGDDEIIINRGHVDEVSGGEGADRLQLFGEAADYTVDGRRIGHSVLGDVTSTDGSFETVAYDNPYADTPAADLWEWDHQESLELALRPDAPTEDLERLVSNDFARGRSPDVAKALLANPATTDGIIQAIANNPYTLDETLSLIAESERAYDNAAIAGALIDHPNAGPRTLDAAFEGHVEDIDLARRLVANPNAPEAALDRVAFVHAQDVEIAKTIAAHPHADTHTLDLLTTIHAQDPEIALSIAEHPDVSPEALDGLASVHGDDLEFARTVATQPQAQTETLDFVLSQHPSDPVILQAIAVHPNASVEAIEAVLDSAHAEEVPQHHGVWSRIGDALGWHHSKNAEHLQQLEDDLAHTFEAAGNVLEDAGHTVYDLFHDPSLLGSDFAHFEQDYTDAKWSAIEVAGDAAALLIPDNPAAQAAVWVEQNLVEPAAGWVGDHLVAPASRFIWSHVVDPANSAVAGMLAKATGLPEAQIEGFFEAEEQSIYDFTKGFLEEGYTIVEGTLEMFASPGEAIHNMTRMAHLAATDPHKLWDAIRSNYDGESASEVAGNLAADILSLFVAPEDILALGAEEAAARGAQASTELAKTVATSMEMREAELTNQVTLAEENLRNAEVGTEAWRDAREEVAEAHKNLLDERSEQVGTYNSLKDNAVGQRDYLQQRLENPNLSTEDRASLQQSLDETEAQIKYLEHQEFEAVAEHGEHLDALEENYKPASRPAAELSTVTRNALEELATRENITITPFVEDGELGFFVEGVRPGRANQVANGLRSTLRETMPEFEMSLGQNVRMDALLQSAPENASLLPSVESGNPRLGRGGARAQEYPYNVRVEPNAVTDETLASWGRPRTVDWAQSLSPRERVIEQERLAQILDEAAEEQEMRVSSRRFRHPLKDTKLWLDEVITAEQRVPGGVGAPGFTLDNVSNASRLSPTDAIQHVTDSILAEDGEAARQAVRDARIADSPAAAEAARMQSAGLIRRIDYPGAPAGEVHAVGVGNDVLAASWYGAGRHASAYSEIADHMDVIANRVGRQRVADIVEHYMSGATTPPDLTGISNLEAAQIREFTTIQIAERGREFTRIAEAGAADQNLIGQALNNAVEHGFYETYARNPGRHAIFAQSGGQDALRAFYESVEVS